MVEQTYLLQRNSKEAEALRSITKKELIDFYERFFVNLDTTTTYVLYVSKENVSKHESRCESDEPRPVNFLGTSRPGIFGSC